MPDLHPQALPLALAICGCPALLTFPNTLVRVIHVDMVVVQNLVRAALLAATIAHRRTSPACRAYCTVAAPLLGLVGWSAAAIALSRYAYGTFVVLGLFGYIGVQVSKTIKNDDENDHHHDKEDAADAAGPAAGLFRAISAAGGAYAAAVLLETLWTAFDQVPLAETSSQPLGWSLWFADSCAASLILSAVAATTLFAGDLLVRTPAAPLCARALELSVLGSAAVAFGLAVPAVVAVFAGAPGRATLLACGAALWGRCAHEGVCCIRLSNGLPPATLDDLPPAREAAVEAAAPVRGRPAAVAAAALAATGLYEIAGLVSWGGASAVPFGLVFGAFGTGVIVAFRERGPQHRVLAIVAASLGAFASIASAVHAASARKADDADHATGIMLVFGTRAAAFLALGLAAATDAAATDATATDAAADADAEGDHVALLPKAPAETPVPAPATTAPRRLAAAAALSVLGVAVATAASPGVVDPPPFAAALDDIEFSVAPLPAALRLAMMCSFVPFCVHGQAGALGRGALGIGISLAAAVTIPGVVGLDVGWLLPAALLLHVSVSAGAAVALWKTR